ncbi:MAG: transglutaminase family protein [Oscillospiraceae bacterium]
MKLNFNYEMTLMFDNPIKDHYFSLHIEPICDSSQKLYSYQYDVIPCEYCSREVDWCGNAQYVGSSISQHDFFGFVSSGVVFTSDNLIKSTQDVAIYKYPSYYADINSDMVQFLNAMDLNHLNDLEKSNVIMHRLHQYLTYQSMSTSISTKATDSFMQKTGVCQDYSHIFISLLRWLKIPSRYVSGLMYENGLVKYNSTHAWVEVYYNGFWYGLDPTNDCEINQGYISFAKGRDYQDCSVDKGVFKGYTVQNQYISISITG